MATSPEAIAFALSHLRSDPIGDALTPADRENLIEHLCDYLDEPVLEGSMNSELH